MFVGLIPAAFAQAEGVGRQESIVSMVTGSGPVVQLVLYLLILFSVFSWGIIFYKLRQIHVARSQSKRFTEIFWDTKNLTAIHTASQELKLSPVAHVFRACYQEPFRTREPFARERRPIRRQEPVHLELLRRDRTRAIRRACNAHRNSGQNPR